MALKLKGGNAATTEMADDEAVSEVVEQEEVTSQAEAQEAEQEEVEEQEEAEDVELAEIAEARRDEPTREVEIKQQAESKAVQTRQSTAVQAASTPASAESYFAAMIKAMEESGHGGMEMGYGVFPVVALDKGEFKVGDEDVGRDPFKVVPLLSRPKFAYRTTGVPDKDAEVAFADSDREHLDPGSAVAQKILEWAEKFEKSGWEVKKYLDVFAYVVSFPANTKLEGQIVQLSVSPTSVKLYTRAGITARSKGYMPHECVYEVSVGEKIRGEFDYYPWQFEVPGSCRKFGVEVKFGSEKDEDF